MAKDPAFLFYSKDWIQGTSKLFPAEKGVYIDLLAHQHQDGFLPSEINRLAKMVGISEQDFIVIWETLKDKFFNLDGKLYNKKLEELILDRQINGQVRSVVGAFGRIIRQLNIPNSERALIKEMFDFNEFLSVPKQTLSKTLATWVANTQQRLANGNANGSITISTDSNYNIPNGKISKEEWTKIRTEFENDQIWKESFCMKKSLDLNELDRILKTFLDDLDLKGDFKEKNDLISHFINWYNKRGLNDKPKPPKNWL